MAESKGIASIVAEVKEVPQLEEPIELVVGVVEQLVPRQVEPELVALAEGLVPVVELAFVDSQLMEERAKQFEVE